MKKLYSNPFSQDKRTKHITYEASSSQLIISVNIPRLHSHFEFSQAIAVGAGDPVRIVQPGVDVFGGERGVHEPPHSVVVDVSQLAAPARAEGLRRGPGHRDRRGEELVLDRGRARRVGGSYLVAETEEEA